MSSVVVAARHCIDVLVVSSYSTVWKVGALHRASDILFCFPCVHDMLKLYSASFSLHVVHVALKDPLQGSLCVFYLELLQVC